MSEWQPIETAPKDGTRILVFDVSEHYGDEPKGTNITVVRYVSYSNKDFRHPGGYWNSPYGPCRADNATHWMPLPPPPTQEGME